MTALSAGFDGDRQAADPHLKPDGRFLCPSERSSSTISTLRVDSGAGLLRPLGRTLTEKTLGGFPIDSSGSFLIAARQDANTVSPDAIDTVDGAFGVPRPVAVGANPNWLEIVDLP